MQDTYEDLPVTPPSFEHELEVLARPLELKEGLLCIRMFREVTGNELMAFILHENKDSFLIGMPAYLESIENKTSVGISVQLINTSSIVKLYKSSISMMMLPSQRFLFGYLTAVKPVAPKMPGYFNEQRAPQLELLLGILAKSLQVEQSTPKTMRKPIQKEASTESDEEDRLFYSPDNYYPLRTKH